MWTTLVKPSGEKEVIKISDDRNAWINKDVVLAGMPGVETGSSTRVSVRNSAGLVLNVTFFWLKPDSPMQPPGN